MSILSDAARPFAVLSLAMAILCRCESAELSLAENAPPGPLVIQVVPSPGFVNELTSVTVTFSRPVTGVRADDLLINGTPANTVAGTGVRFTFSFPQPAFGPVDISWGTLHTIADLEARRFDGGASGSTWAYQLINPFGAIVTQVFPVPGMSLRALAEVEVSFNRPVEGIDASDLRMNGAEGTSVTGVGAGPYRFSFSNASAGEVSIEWNPNHGIVTDNIAPVFFTGFPWKYQVNPAQPPPNVIINEIMAENQTGIVDEEKDPEDWIELHNLGGEAANLEGWSLSVDREEEGQWVFPSMILPPGGYLVLWASGKDRQDLAANQRLHTNFKLNPNGDTLRLFGPELPRTLVDELEYPEQSPNHSYGRRLENARTKWRYSAEATPGVANGSSAVIGKVDEVHFSVERGFFNAAFALSLACRTPGAEIRYTLDGSVPMLTNGIVYAAPIAISATRIVRAAAFAASYLPSRVRTHTYLMNLANNRRLLPVLSLVTATNHLYGRNGIMEYNPRNTTKHGPAWERPVSVELIRPGDNGGFQLDAGIRVAGGDYIRGLYNYRNSGPPQGKYSFRLYFRGEYGPGRLNYPIFPGSTLDSYNNLHLRAGMNDHTNPFIKDEFIRALSLDVGIPASHGTFVYLFLNGVFKGLYNPCERVDDDFLQAYHGGGKFWDVMGPNNQAIRGDSAAWSQLRTVVRRNLTIETNYLAVAARMDLTNFVDYLLPLVWADNDDWPHNNTRAARERKPGTKFRFYPWDAEFAFTSHGVSYDTIATTLSTLSPPWGTTDYQAMFNSLKKSPEFRLLFADRVHRAFFNDGPLTDARIRTRYNLMKARVATSIPGFSDVIGTWINGRRRYITNSFQKAGFLASSNAPVAGQFGGRVPSGYQLTLSNLFGTILYTTNGTDPRVPFKSARSSSAAAYTQPLTISSPLRLMARSLNGTNWSALIDVSFDVTQMGSQVRVTELMYNPPGGDPFEFIELQNTGGLAADVSEFSFDGINFRFPTSFPPLAPGARIVLANGARQADFLRRYPNQAVAGWFTGSLDNGGERIVLLNPFGRIVTSVDYDDQHPWPVASDGAGASLEVIDPRQDPDDPSNWHASVPGGSPGAINSAPPKPAIRINELQAGADRDWIELFNPNATAVRLGGWTITDNSDPRQFVFPPNTTIAGGGFLRIDCSGGSQPGPINAPFRLNRDGETIALFDAETNPVDAVQYGPVVAGLTIGLVDNRLALCVPTPLGPNEAKPLGPATTVKINEFLANPDSGDDWVELHNSGAEPVSLQGFSVLTSNAIAGINSPAFIAPSGFVVFRADENPGPGHLDLKLPANGGFIALLTPNGEELDRIAYGIQLTGITTGRLPDGIGSFQQLPYSPTRGTSNYLAELGSRIRISEVLARSSAGPDWVEIENVSSQAISLAGHSFGINTAADPLTRWPFPAGAQLNAGERMVLYFGTVTAGFNPWPKSQSYPTPLQDSHSVLTLRDPLDRIIDRVEYGPQLTGRSIGRVNQEWMMLASPSPGTANGRAALLDAGTGLRFNEWLAASGGAGEFVEIYNPAALPVHLANWTLTDDPSIRGSTNRNLTPLTFIDSGGYIRFHTDGASERGPDHLSFQLDRWGETIRLLNSSAQVIDTVNFVVQTDSVSEGRFPDGAQRIVRFPGSTSPAASNYLRLGDLDKDGIEDAWELLNGLDPDSAADAAGDLDKDGLSNLQEFVTGTDPLDPASLFRIEITGADPSSPAIRFTVYPGRTYRIEYTSNLTPANWIRLIEIPSSETAREIAVTDPASQEQRTARFYRVLVFR